MRKALGVFLVAAICCVASPANACGPPFISFASGSTQLNAAAWREINYAIGDTRTWHNLRVRLEATGDGRGPEAVNTRLARSRAQAVRAALIRRGVPSRIVDIDAASISAAGRVPPGGMAGIIIEVRRGYSSGCAG